MRRRGMVGRPGGGLIGTMATTAVVVGTAKATSNAMDRHAAGKQQEAGRLFAAIANDKQVPDSLRARSVQIAGSLGVDASAALGASNQ